MNENVFHQHLLLTEREAWIRLNGLQALKADADEIEVQRAKWAALAEALDDNHLDSLQVTAS